MSKNWEPYFSQRVKNLFDSLQRWSEDSDPSSLHDLRVEIKKCLAILRFLRKEYPGHHLHKERDAIKRIFQELGQLREYHIMEEWLLHQQHLLIRNRCFPKEDVQALTRELTGKAKSYSKRLKQCHKTIEDLVAKTPDEKIKKYLAGLYDEINLASSKSISQSDWHSLRKKIKQWIYASNWLPGKRNQKEEKILTGFHTLEEAIGKWHDLEKIRDTLTQRQQYFSKDLSLQLCFSQASDQLKRAIQYRKRKVTELL